MLSGKKILLGVSGSIAAYKAADILRRLQDLEAEVRVVLSRNAGRFVTPLTFSALSRKPVLADEFSMDAWGATGHVSVTDDLDLALVAPATADIIGKAANGIADDALSTALLALPCSLIMAPAMNDRMYRNAAVQRNISLLRSGGVRFVDPDSGDLACGRSGQGRLATTERIIRTVTDTLTGTRELAGCTVLVTAGPTRERIDAVRFLSNPSSGKMGYAVAAAARDRGADVVLVSGPCALQPPFGVSVVQVSSASEMRKAVLAHFEHSRIVIMAAAVSDFRPASFQDRKIKKRDAPLEIRLERTEDILEELGSKKSGKILVGFAAETQELKEEAGRKLTQKNLDLIVANLIGTADRGFGSDMNVATIMTRSGEILELPRMTKDELADRILDKAAELLSNQGL